MALVPLLPSPSAAAYRMDPPASLASSLTAARIVIGDRDPQNARLLTLALGRAGFSNMAVVATRDDLLAACAAGADLVILDLDVPGCLGLDLLPDLRELDCAGGEAPVLALTSDASGAVKRRALAAGAREVLTKPFSIPDAVLLARNLLDGRLRYTGLRRRSETLEQLVKERTRELETARLDMIERLCQAVEFRDDVTGRHTRRVGERSALLAGAIGLPVEEVELIRLAAPLHDVGKIAIPDAILLKAGPLTAAEFAAMQSHTTIGGRILSGGGAPLLETAEAIARCHHERWDGQGYPNGRRGRETPVAARIVAIVDVFDALTTSRPYRLAWDESQAREAIRTGSGSHFDPELAEAFLALDLPAGDETHSPLTE